MDEEYGVMIGVINGKIKRVPLAECAGKLKMVSPKDQLKSSQTDWNQFWRLMNHKSSGRRGSLSAATVAKRRRVL